MHVHGIFCQGSQHCPYFTGVMYIFGTSSVKLNCHLVYFQQKEHTMYDTETKSYVVYKRLGNSSGYLH